MRMALVSTLISCANPSAVPDATSFPSYPLQVEKEVVGTAPFPWEVSLTYPSSRSYLNRYLSDCVVKITMPGNEGEASTNGQFEYPNLDQRVLRDPSFPSFSNKGHSGGSSGTSRKV